MGTQDFCVIKKEVGETPLQALERYRIDAGIPSNVPLAYAGRLDPMASGKLLILIGDECKRQKAYHQLHKEYEFEVLFGVRSDTGDVLGLVDVCGTPKVSADHLQQSIKKLVGPITLPYPNFSSKTVSGKPLHVWTLEGRLSEINVPSYTSEIFLLKLVDFKHISHADVYETSTKKIETIPKVTEESKALGNDFRRPEIRTAWQKFNSSNWSDEYSVATFRCVCSAGLYMRTLAGVIARTVDTCGIAYSIHRTKIGSYQKLPFGFGVWLKQF